jgi:hypothetical protein
MTPEIHPHPHDERNQHDGLYESRYGGCGVKLSSFVFDQPARVKVVVA